MTPAGLAALMLERDNLVVALEAAEDAREDAIGDANGWARLLNAEKGYTAELKALVMTLRADAARDAATIARLRREVAQGL